MSQHKGAAVQAPPTIPETEPSHFQSNLSSAPCILSATTECAAALNQHCNITSI